MEALIFILTGIAVFSILIVPLSAKLQAPILLLFLGFGMLLGEDGPIGIEFDNFSFAYTLGSLCLAMILLSGGLDTKLKNFKKAGAPSGILATLGVLLTAIPVGVAYHFIFDRPLAEGMLLGSVVGSTDAAATFMLLNHSKVAPRTKIKDTLFIESGLNDPIAIFLTLTFVTIVDTGATLSFGSIIGAMPSFIQQIGLGLIGGIAGGALASFIVSRVTLPSGLNSPFFLMAGLCTYAGVALAGGSGFLAVYLFGVTVANTGKHGKERLAQFHDGLAWLAQIAMFVMLGVLVTPSALPEMVAEGLILAAILIFIARPLAVLLCLWPFKFSLSEKLYVGWVGLRGAVPIFLAIIPVISPGPITPDFFNLVFIMVGASLFIQGWTVSPAGRLFKIEASTQETDDKKAATAVADD